jgi:LPS sulfotransferase NodH
VADRTEALPRFLSSAADFPRMDAARERFAIFSQQRSGSSWLSVKLTNLGKFGFVHEYLNGRFARPLMERLGVEPRPDGSIPLQRYLRALEQVRTSPNGCFGIKVQPNQLQEHFGADRDGAVKMLAGFERIIVLTRDDKVGQAVSGAMSEAVGRWAYPKGQDHDLSNVRMEDLLQDAVAKLHRYTQEESAMAALVKAAGVPSMDLTYERLVAQTESEMDRIVRFLGHAGGLSSLPAVGKWEPEPPPGKVGAEIRRRFLLYIQGWREEALADAPSPREPPDAAN